MPSSVRELLSQVHNRHQHFGMTLAIGTAVGVGHSFSLAKPLVMILSTLLFLLGVFLAHLAFLLDSQLQQTAHRRLTIGETSGELISGQSPLRQGIMLLLLPVLALFLISSTRAALGLGFIWGLSGVYWWELLGFFRGEAARLQATYFHQFPPGSPVVLGITCAYLIYGLLLTAGILLVRGQA